jgi:DNA-3-methyladenine glycosylase
MARLTRDFFARPCLEVAPDLLGCRLVHLLPDGSRLAGRIVELEAYLGRGTDPASHAYRGTTPRNQVMFGPPGRLYVYRTMGLHVCANVVCEPEGSAAAVLLRAVEPTEGLDVMRARRGRGEARELASGPGKLAQAFGIGLEYYGRGIARGPLRIEPAEGQLEQRILAGPRIGISRGAELPYRFFLAACPYVTRSPRNREAHPYLSDAQAAQRRPPYS